MILESYLVIWIEGPILDFRWLGCQAFVINEQTFFVEGISGRPTKVYFFTGLTFILY